MSKSRIGRRALGVLACSSLAVLLMGVPAIAVGQEERGRARASAAQREGRGGGGDSSAKRRDDGRGNHSADRRDSGRRDSVAAHGQPPGGGGGGNPGGGGGGNPGGGNPGGGNAGGRPKVTICHSTGSASNPYRVVTVAEPALPAHLAHGDIYPVPATGCPGAGGGTNNVTICHFTGVAAAPYVEQVIPVAALNAHLLHGDIYPVPIGGCPGADVDEDPGNVTVCHLTGVAAAPYVEQVIPTAQLGDHLRHGDIYPVPVDGCPDAPVGGGAGNVTVCHFTGVAGAPYVEQVIPIAALGSHLLHGDIYPVPVGGCPGADVDEDGNVTICHFASAAGAPYVELVIPIATLSSHLLHGDIYPVPVGGCFRVAGEIDYGEPPDDDDPVTAVQQPQRQRPGINASVEPGAQVAVTGGSVLGFLLFSLSLIASGVVTLWRSKRQG